MEIFFKLKFKKINKMKVTPEIGEDVNVVMKYGLRVYLGFSKTFLEIMSFDQDFKSWLLWLVLKVKDAGVREQAILVFESLCKHLIEREEEKYKRILWDIIFHLLSTLDIIEEYDNQSVQYFKLITRLITSYGSTWPLEDQIINPESENSDDSDTSKFTSLLNTLEKLIKILKCHPIQETELKIHQGYEDGVVIGVLNLLTSLFSTNPKCKYLAKSSEKGLLRQVFYNCLFDIPNAQKLFLLYFYF